jgi:paraquat-inducible protein B
MSKQASATRVGAFVVGAAVLTVAGILIFGRGDPFREQFKMVAFFESSVAGLDIGAPLRFRGVPVGTVSGIHAVWSSEEEAIRIPVELAFVSGSVRTPADLEAHEFPYMDTQELMERLIERGLRAELQQDSIVTGKLFVALDFYPDSPIRRLGGTELPEMPTTETGLDKLKREIEQLELRKLVDQAIEAIAAIERLATNPKIEQSLAKLMDLFDNTDQRLAPVLSSTEETLKELQSLVRSVDAEVKEVSAAAQKLIAGVDAQVEPLGATLQAALDEARATMGQAHGLMEDDSTLLYRVAKVLEELAAAARSVRVLADFLERHPEAILTGKEVR